MIEPFSIQTEVLSHGLAQQARGTHTQKQIFKRTLCPPTDLDRNAALHQKQSLLFEKWPLECGDLVPCMAKRNKDERKKQRQTIRRENNSSPKDWKNEKGTPPLK